MIRRGKDRQHSAKGRGTEQSENSSVGAYSEIGKRPSGQLTSHCV